MILLSCKNKFVYLQRYYVYSCQAGNDTKHMEQYKGVCLSLIHIVIACPSAAVVAAVIAVGIGCLVRERCRTTGKSFTVGLTLKC